MFEGLTNKEHKLLEVYDDGDGNRMDFLHARNILRTKLKDLQFDRGHSQIGRTIFIYKIDKEVN